MWKYAASNAVSGTPTAFVNGNKLEKIPSDVDGWLEVLNSVHNSQWSQ